MPKVLPIYQPNDRDVWDAINAAADAERKERNALIDRAWRYYEGDHPLPLKVSPGKPNHNVIMNLAGQAVDNMVSFLGVPRLSVIGGAQREPDESGVLQDVKSGEQVALESLWLANDLEIFMVDQLMDAAVTGHTFVRLIPSDEGVQISLLDGRYVTAFWNVNNIRQILFYRLAWVTDGNNMTVQDIVPRRLLNDELSNDGWAIIEYAVKQDKRYVETARDGWDYDFAPIVDWKNAPNPHQYYGKSDLARVGLNDSVNFAASNINKIIYHHGGPQTVLTGGRLDEDAETGPGTVISVPDPNAKLYNLEMQSDLVSSMEFMDTLRGAFFSEKRVVDPAAIKDKLGALTNFAVRMLYTSQLNAADMKMLLHGRGVAEVTRRALELINVMVERVESKWDDPLPQDRGEIVKAAKIESDLGVTSKQTIQEELGRDPAQESERMDDEQTDAANATADLLTQMGQRGGLL